MNTIFTGASVVRAPMADFPAVLVVDRGESSFIMTSFSKWTPARMRIQSRLDFYFILLRRKVNVPGTSVEFTKLSLVCIVYRPVPSKAMTPVCSLTLVLYLVYKAFKAKGL